MKANSSTTSNDYIYKLLTCIYTYNTTTPYQAQKSPASQEEDLIIMPHMKKMSSQKHNSESSRPFLIMNSCFVECWLSKAETKHAQIQPKLISHCLWKGVFDLKNNFDISVTSISDHKVFYLMIMLASWTINWQSARPPTVALISIIQLKDGYGSHQL